MQYFSFLAYMKKMKYTYNEYLWNSDIMYKAKIWKARKYGYIRFCRKYNYPNEADILNEECMEYELRLLSLSYTKGMMSNREYIIKESEIRNIYK